MMEQEFVFEGVPMRPDQDTFKIPVKPGWEFVAATRGTFGAQLIYQRVSPNEEQEGVLL
jgi:hypothetical protein